MAMHMITNKTYTRPADVTARVRRAIRSASLYVVAKLIGAWNQAFPMPPHTNPTAPPTIAKAAALREGALLSEDVDATGRKSVA